MSAHLVQTLVAALSGTMEVDGWVAATGWLLCGLALFLLGMDMTAKGMRSALGGKTRRAVDAVTANRISAFGVGTAAAALLQSSSAATVILVGLADAGVLSLRHAVGVILGAKVGTTATTQLIAFDLSAVAPWLVAVGFGAHLGIRARWGRTVGALVLGFGLIFLGMGVMADAMVPVRRSEAAMGVLEWSARYPLAGLAVATAFTAVVQSSAATIGIVIALAAAGVLSLHGALPLVFGAHVGTCATALLASVSAGYRGRQVAVAHLLVSVVAVVVAWPFATVLADVAARTAPAGDTARAVANAHLLFAAVTSGLLLAAAPLFARLTQRLVPDKATGFVPRHMHPAAQEYPEMALHLVHLELCDLFAVVHGMLEQALGLLADPAPDADARLDEADNALDATQKAVCAYVAGIPSDQLSSRHRRYEQEMVHVVQMIESMGDLITKEVAHAAKKLDKHQTRFSQEGLEELRAFGQATLARLHAVREAFARMDADAAAAVAAQDEDNRAKEHALRARHLNRLHAGFDQSLETSSWHLSTLSALRTLNEKITEIARAVVELAGEGQSD